MEIRDGFRTVGSLLTHLEIPSSNLNSLIDPSAEFPMRVSLSFANKMKKADPTDPLFLQVIPQLQEKISSQGFKLDSVGDLDAVKTKGLIQKYNGRVLLLMTGACAIHCRYCFRRHFPYEEYKLTSSSKDQLISIIENDPTIEEVIFSGGDPLLLSNDQLFDWIKILKNTKNIKRLRIHSRLTTVLPSRFDSGLLEVLSFFQMGDRKTILVNHINHPNEIDETVKFVFSQLKKADITLLNQSVLLHQINDQMSILKLLSEKLFQAGALPYYLHLLDRTMGTHHFEVDEKEALKIHSQLAANLPGYLVPKLVREIQGQPYKVMISSPSETPTAQI